MCPRPEQQIVDACVRAANAMHEAEEYALEGKHLEESRRILVAMKYERALAIFDKVTGMGERGKTLIEVFEEAGWMGEQER